MKECQCIVRRSRVKSGWINLLSPSLTSSRCADPESELEISRTRPTTGLKLAYRESEQVDNDPPPQVPRCISRAREGSITCVHDGLVKDK